jgi:replicative DNA helicase
MAKQTLEGKWEEFSKRILYACILDPSILDTIGITPADLHPAVSPTFTSLQRKRAAGILDDAYVLTRYTADELELMDPGDWQAALRAIKPLAARAKLAMALQDAYRDVARRPLQDLVAELQEAAKYALRVSEDGASSKPLQPAAGLVDEVLSLVFRMADGERPYVTTTYRNLDHILGGFWPGNMYVFAGRPGIGKTALAVNLLYRLAGNHPTSFITCEMTLHELTMRLLALISKVSYFHIRTGRLDRYQREALERARARIPAHLDLVEASGKPVEDVCGMVMDAAGKGCRVVIIDYLQRIPYPRGLDSMDLAVGHICKALKNVALKANVAVVVLAQLNRQVEQTSSRRPELHHLRESGNIEQEADVVGFLYREGYYAQERRDAPERLELIIRKNRHGPVGTADLVFTPPTMLIEDREDDK